MKKLQKVTLLMSIFGFIVIMALVVVSMTGVRAYDQARGALDVPVAEAERVSLLSVALDDYSWTELETQDERIVWLLRNWAETYGITSEEQPAEKLFVSPESIGMRMYHDGDKLLHGCVFFIPYDAQELKFKSTGSAAFRDYAEYLRDGYFLMPDKHLVKTDIMGEVEKMKESSPDDDGVLVFLEWQNERNGGVVEDDWSWVREIGEFRLKCLEEGADMTDKSFWDQYDWALTWQAYLYFAMLACSVIIVVLLVASMMVDKKAERVKK